MTVTVNAPFKAPPRISKSLWLDEIAVSYDTPLWNGVPAEDRSEVAAGLYDFIVRSGHDPAIWLAIAMCEHSLGTNPDSVLHRNDTRSWTNARTVRDPSLSGYTTVRDAKRGTKYVKYQSVVDSVQDGLYRVDEPGYAYRKAGAVSIIDHTMIWTEGDGPEYAAKMVTLINRWIAEDDGGQPVEGDIPGVPFIPADARHHTRGRRDPWPSIIILHHTDGYDSLGWLTTNPNSDVSATLLLNHDGTIRAQLVRLADTPHTTGRMNDDSLSIEWERKWPDQKDISTTQYRNIGESVAKLYLAERKRGNPYFQGSITRDHLGKHNDYYQTTCPGNLDLAKVLLTAAQIVNVNPKPAPWYLHLGNGVMAEYPFELGFRDFVLAQSECRFPVDPNSAALAMFGEPKEREWVGVDGHTYQRCKRVTLHYIPGNVAPWDVIIERVGMPLPERKP